MGQGLGRNSPVQLSLGKDNYCALIERHGQWIRWRNASKCSCIKYGSMQPDIRCKLCGGRGYIYSYQKSQVTFESVPLKDINTGILEVSEQNKKNELIEVYDFNGKRYSNAEKLDSYIYLNETNLPKKDTYFNVIMRKSIEQFLDSVIAEKCNLGYYKIKEITSQKPNIDGVYYSAPGDIISIGKVIDAAGIEYNAKDFRLNQFYIEEKKDDEGEPIPITEPVTVQDIKYIPPYIFALLSQNLSKGDLDAMVEAKGDAVCTFPFECDVSNDDVLTVLAGSYTNKEVMVRQRFKTDTLGAFFIYDIVSCSGIQDGEIVEYKEGTDFIIVDQNKIKWLESGNYPEEGETYSIVYHVMPTYRVVKEIPQIRTSENQRFPKKAVVKLFTSYSENSAVNKQKFNKEGFDGSY